MTRTIRLALAAWLGAAALVAQTTTASVQAIGTATIYVQPNQAQLTVSVTTTGTTATAAGQQNANVTVAVTQAINSVLGASGSIQTVSYSVYPQYSNGTATQPSTIVGYSATNTFQVTMTDLTLIGRIIDTANQAGATSVGSLTLGLQNPAPSLQQALAAASQQALANAGAIASGLGGKTGAVMSAQQSSAYTPTLVAVASPGATTTPVQTGPVSVSATVTVTVQLQ
ncbi:MAG: SIMPL domain-containing protein [Bryobacteraceae bacterium]|jgi:uncharacterized protein YggE